jgi:hypothetical protein
MIAGSWRTRILVIVALALAVGGVVKLLDDRSSSPPAQTNAAAGTAQPGDVAVTTILPDPRALQHVTVSGATADETAAVHDLLPLLGPDSGIDRVTFARDATSGDRRLVITQPTGDPQRAWLGEVFARNVVARLRDRGETIASYSFTGRPGTKVSAGAPTSQNALGAAVADATASLRRERAHADLTVYPIGAVAVTLQLDERAMLGRPRTNWLDAAGDGDADDVARFIDVLAPDGTRIFYRGARTCSGACGGPATDVPGTPLPGDISAPSAFTIHVTLPSRTPAVAHPPDVRASCAGSAPSAVAALCHAIVLDRYRLLQPLPTRPTCTGRLSFATVAVRGTIGGMPIAREYGMCESGISNRWIALLRRHGFLPPGKGGTS